MIRSRLRSPRPRVARGPRRTRRERHVRLAFVAAAVLAGALPVAAGQARAANPDALWSIVQGRCVPDQERNGDPAPCELVDLEGGVARGYAVLKDLVGATQFLLLPTVRIDGIESPALLAPGAPNYFEAAWQSRGFVEARAHRRLPRDAISLAINSAYRRTQNQLHIHVDCVAAEVRDALRRHAAVIGGSWARFPEPLAGSPYMAMRVTGSDLGSADPFRLVADGIPGAREEMGRHTIVVVGATFPDSGAGFVVLDGRTEWASLRSGSGELLQDHGCALARS